MSRHRRNQIKDTEKRVGIQVLRDFLNPPQKIEQNIKDPETVHAELKTLWTLSTDNPHSLISRIHSFEKRNYEIGFKIADSLDEYATNMAIEHLETISLTPCLPSPELRERHTQAMEEILSVPIRKIAREEWGFIASRKLRLLSVAVMERAEITFFNDIISVSVKLIELETQLENEIMRYLLNLIPSSLYSYYLSQKGQFDVMNSLSPIQRLQKICQNYLEMSLQSPPVIHRSSSINQDVVEKLEQLINETKQAKRMTFKTAEEIKQVVLEASGVEEEVAVSDNREMIVSTVIELYDSMFHLVRMFKTNGNEELFTATSKELKRMEILLREIDLEALNSIGKQIDPTFMQGVAVVSSAEANGLNQYVVHDEIRKGFKDLKENRVIREAQVITVLN